LQRGYESETSSSITGPIRFDSMGRRRNFTIYVVEGNRDDLIAKWNPDDPKVVQFLKSEEDRNKALEKKWKEGTVIVASM
jgi:hypothetical protein